MQGAGQHNQYRDSNLPFVNAQSNVTAPPLPPAREGHDCFLESRTLSRDYKWKKLEQAPIICFRVGGSFSQNLETTFLLGLGGMVWGGIPHVGPGEPELIHIRLPPNKYYRYSSQLTHSIRLG